MSFRPLIITTWKFGLDAARVGWLQLAAGMPALDAVEAAANTTEEDPSVNSVGLGGLPNANGQVELDAAIMEGRTHAAGSVAGLAGYPRPISVARRVMEVTPHVMLVGANAAAFAEQQGFQSAELLTDASRESWQKWRAERSKAEVAHFDTGTQARVASPSRLVPDDHDTIGLCALDSAGNLAAGCTTSGMAWKIPGRVGDSPIVGSGLYVDNEVGAAAATGHGDEMMKTCLSYRVVMLMAQGHSPQEACAEALRYLLRKRPVELHAYYGAALIAIDRQGRYGAAATASGFSGPDRVWQWCLASADSPDGALHEGPYVTPSHILSTAISS